MPEPAEHVVSSRLPKKDPGPTAGRSLWEYVEFKVDDVVCQSGDKKLMIDGTTDASYTYLEFRSLVKKTASVLRRKFDVGPDSIVIICSKNSLYFPVCLYASASLGATTFSIPAYSHDSIPFCLREDTKVAAVFCDDDVLPHVKRYVEEAGSRSSASSDGSWRRPTIFLVDGEDDECGNACSLFRSPDADENFGLPTVDPAKESLVFFSSGSTGPPKPICHSHRTLLSCTFNTHVGPTDCAANDVKLYNVNHAHLGGVSFFLGIISSGSTCVTFSIYQPERLLEAIHRYRVKNLNLYPKDAICLSKVEKWDQYDLSCVKSITSSAAVFPITSAVPRLKKMFPGLVFPIIQVYGCTELLLVSSSMHTGVGEKESGVGHLMPYNKCKVVHLETKEVLGPRGLGELWLYSPYRMLGYWRRPDLTAEAITPEGWYKSGDFGYYDEEERLHIVDRVKDMIRLGSGQLVSPSEIEDIILRHSNVLQVGVAGIPSPCGDRPRAFVIPRPGTDLSPADVVSFVESETEDAQHLHLTGGAEFIQSMITSPGGKVYRMKLRNDYLEKMKKSGMMHQLPENGERGDHGEQQINGC